MSSKKVSSLGWSQVHQAVSVNYNVPLLGGEKIDAVYPDVTYLCPYSLPPAVIGTLTVTNYRLFFRSAQRDGFSPVLLDVPLGVINRIVKKGGQRKSPVGEYGITVFCKDIRNFRFNLSKSKEHPRKDIYDSIYKYCFPLVSGIGTFAFNYEDEITPTSNGWRVYDAIYELKRQGLPNESWNISRINESFGLCETYPQVLGLPAAVMEDDLDRAASFRSKNRLPVLSWLHPVSLASITRCSQPLVGVTNNRSKYDEDYISAIREANPQSHRITIVDARPKMNAMANSALGGGYEKEDFYSNVDLHFADIHNIHVMRQSYSRLEEICFPVIDSKKWLSNVDSTGWLDHLQHILSAAVLIAGKVEKDKCSVIVHCSDGWDRTSQLTSLAMIFLDPFYRTLKGFQILIEKEWISFGHKFADRLGHGDAKYANHERSPVFLQFIDCVWQVLNQFPYSFEFNETFLLLILDHIYSNLFGTFLCNNEKERASVSLRRHTKSLWSYVNEASSDYLNPGFMVRSMDRVIIPAPAVCYMKVWSGYYCRWNPRMRPHWDGSQRNIQVLNQRQQLKNRWQDLSHELEEQIRLKSSNTRHTTNGLQ